MIDSEHKPKKWKKMWWNQTHNGNYKHVGEICKAVKAVNEANSKPIQSRNQNKHNPRCQEEGGNGNTLMNESATSLSFVPLNFSSKCFQNISLTKFDISLIS